MKKTENKSMPRKEEEEEEEEEEVEPVSPAGRLMHAPTFNIAVVLVMGYNTKIDPNLYKKCMQQTVIKHPRISSILTTKNGKTCWKRVAVDMDSHVFVPDLDPDMESPDEFVVDFATNLSEIPMDMTKPLWELYILNVKTSDANAVVVIKLHHSLGDGVSLVALTHACSRKLDDPDALPVFPASKEPKKKKSVGRYGAVMRLLVSIWTVMLIAFYTLVDIVMYIATLSIVRDSKTPIKAGRGVPPQQRRRFVHRICRLGDVKMIKTAMNASVNDVVLGVTEAGLSRYLNSIYEREKGKGKTKSSYLPRNLGVRSTVVFNLRRSPTIEDLAEMMEKEELNKMWGNLIGIVLLPFTLSLEEDPLTYIRRAKTTMDRKKLSIGHKCAYFLMKHTMLLFGTKAAAFVTTAVFRNTTFTFSNVMGPKEEVSLFGHHLSYIAPSVCGFPQSLIVHYQSYGEKMIISVGADEKLIPNPHQLCDEMIKALQNMKEAVIKREVV